LRQSTPFGVAGPASNYLGGNQLHLQQGTTPAAIYYIAAVNYICSNRLHLQQSTAFAPINYICSNRLHFRQSTTFAAINYLGGNQFTLEAITCPGGNRLHLQQ
jgi:hypothetical protein